MSKQPNFKNVMFLLNAEWQHQRYPDTFGILSRAEREAVRSGDIVKLAFESKDPNQIGERMWVVVRECVPGRNYIGTLDNYPISLPLQYGCWIRFGPEHILDKYDR